MQTGNRLANPSLAKASKLFVVESLLKATVKMAPDWALCPLMQTPPGFLQTAAELWDLQPVKVVED